MAFRPPVDVRGWILTSTTEVVVRLYLLGHGWVLQLAVLVLVLSPEHPLAPRPDGVGLVQLRVSVMVWLPVPHVLEHSVRPDSAHSDHPPCTDTQLVKRYLNWLMLTFQ